MYSFLENDDFLFHVIYLDTNFGSFEVTCHVSDVQVYSFFMKIDIKNNNYYIYDS